MCILKSVVFPAETLYRTQLIYCVRTRLFFFKISQENLIRTGDLEFFVEPESMNEPDDDNQRKHLTVEEILNYYSTSASMW